MNVNDLLMPYAVGGWAGLVHHDGLSPEAAFDVVAGHAARLEVQAIVGRLRASREGRLVLTQLRRFWDAEGLPPPWDNKLDLSPA